MCIIDNIYMLSINISQISLPDSFIKLIYKIGIGKIKIHTFIGQI